MLSTDPQCILETEDGDIDISGGRTKFAAGLVAAAQQAQGRLGLQRGELFWNRSAGFPMAPNAWVSPLDAVLGDRYSPSVTEAAYREALLDVPNAAEIEKLSIPFDGRLRKVSPRWSLRIAFDDITASVEGQA